MAIVLDYIQMSKLAQQRFPRPCARSLVHFSLGTIEAVQQEAAAHLTSWPVLSRYIGCTVEPAKISS
jgi:hypothetical protein